MTEPQSRPAPTTISLAPGSRATSRKVGALAWVLLEELALRSEGGPVPAAATNVRALAVDLGVGKDAVANALRRLADLGLVRCQSQRCNGRYAGSGYVLDLGACASASLVVTSGSGAAVPCSIPPCPIEPDAAQPDPVDPDASDAGRVKKEPSHRVPPAGRREPSPQSLFDFHDPPSPSSQPPSPSPASRPTPPSVPTSQPHDPSTPPFLLTPSNQPDTSAPEVRQGGGQQ